VYAPLCDAFRLFATAVHVPVVVSVNVTRAFVFVDDTSSLSMSGVRFGSRE